MHKSIIAFALLAGAFTFAADKPQTLTGTVSDTMCGAKHMAGSTPADCTRACVKGGADYALVVGNKVYTLKGHGDDLDKLAGQKATVKGAVSNDTVQVDSVAAAK